LADTNLASRTADLADPAETSLADIGTARPCGIDPTTPKPPGNSPDTPSDERITEAAALR
jgi:hypothetical protein